MKRHQIQTCKGQNGSIPKPTSVIQPSKDKIIGNILNKAAERGQMGVKSNKVPKKSSVIPIEAVNAVKLNSSPKHSDSEETDSDSEMDSEENSDSGSESAKDDVEFMPNKPEELKEAFKDLFKQFYKVL